MESYSETNIKGDPSWPSWSEVELRNTDLLRQESSVTPLIVDVYETAARAIKRFHNRRSSAKVKKSPEPKKSPRSGWIDAGS
jgi:hypothetical protein